MPFTVLRSHVVLMMPSQNPSKIIATDVAPGSWWPSVLSAANFALPNLAVKFFVEAAPFQAASAASRSESARVLPASAPARNALTAGTSAYHGLIAHLSLSLPLDGSQTCLKGRGKSRTIQLILAAHTFRHAHEEASKQGSGRTAVHAEQRPSQPVDERTEALFLFLREGLFKQAHGAAHR